MAVLLVATGFAFVRTESLKLENSPIQQTRVTKLFSPVCGCATSRARIAFRLDKRDVVSATIIDSSGNDVRRLVTGRPAQGLVSLYWNGRDETGRLVRDGFYQARVRLDLAEKTYTLPNLIEVDSKRPVVKSVSVRPRVFSPDGDHRADQVTVRYTLDEPARGLLYVDGIQRLVGSRAQPAGKLRWYGQVDGRSLPAGNYHLVFVAVDPAGNRSRPAPAGTVRIRYLELTPPHLHAKAGGWVSVRVSTDALRVSWRLAGRSGTALAPAFRIRAPTTPRHYLLVVSERGHGAGGTVVVTAR